MKAVPPLHWFKEIMGTRFSQLNPTIQTRLESELFDKGPIHFRGVVSVRASKLGKVLARITDLTTGGCCPYVGENIPVDVLAFHEEGSPDMFKERIYHFPNGNDWHFVTRGHFAKKKFEKEAVLPEFLEYVAWGVGMKLKLVEINGNLQFQANQYFWETPLGFVKMPLWMTPGVLVLDHQYRSDDSFIYKFTMTHPWFGLMYQQEGYFIDTKDKLHEVKATSKNIPKPTANPTPLPNNPTE